MAPRFLRHLDRSTQADLPRSALRKSEECIITIDATRTELEYKIPAVDARLMLSDLCEQPIIEKTRYLIDWEGGTWEVDEFFGVNAGLVVAEVELDDVNQQISFPPWIGEEVTGDPRYFNSNLVARPYSTW